MARRKPDKTNSPDKNISVLDTPTPSPESPRVRRTPNRKKSMNRSKRLTLTPSKRTSGVKKRKRNVFLRVGTKTFTISARILREIKHYQLTTGNLIPKLPFSRLIQELLNEHISQGKRIQKLALEALQEAAEIYLVQFFEDSYVCTLHARRCTLIPRDMEVVKRLRHTV
ncbi:hypothetical protein ILUMI_24572 [Ignelater luminosus]|uniref:Core Histone H2A/H2B/H3 domain-containing protein n=1 Tax=Ignelater luminosus TaxID=2038154 RepID=A0A8K0CA82_IGNLU|nr:hypothetical protein ILUMI_24572 [Ignelater luminosus]